MKAQCKKHPKYKTKVKPRTDCKACWRMFSAEQAARIRRAAGVTMAHG